MCNSVFPTGITCWLGGCLKMLFKYYHTMVVISAVVLKALFLYNIFFKLWNSGLAVMCWRQVRTISCARQSPWKGLVVWLAAELTYFSGKVGQSSVLQIISLTELLTAVAASSLRNFTFCKIKCMCSVQGPFIKLEKYPRSQRFAQYFEKWSGSLIFQY